MNQKHRPNLEKLIKNASEILKVKTDGLEKKNSGNINLAFIRKRERHHPADLIHMLGTPNHKRNSSYRSYKKSLSPLSSTPNFKLQLEGKEERKEKVRDLINSIEEFQIENHMYHKPGQICTSRIKSKAELDQAIIMNKFRRTVYKASRNSA